MPQLPIPVVLNREEALLKIFGCILTLFRQEIGDDLGVHCSFSISQRMFMLYLTTRRRTKVHRGNQVAQTGARKSEFQHDPMITEGLRSAFPRAGKSNTCCRYSGRPASRHAEVLGLSGFQWHSRRRQMPFHLGKGRFETRPRGRFHHTDGKANNTNSGWKVSPIGRVTVINRPNSTRSSLGGTLLCLAFEACPDRS